MATPPLRPTEATAAVVADDESAGASLGLVLCSSGVFVCQSAATSYIHTAAPAGGRASAAGLYVTFYYVGGSVAGVVPGLAWSLGAWTACVILVLMVQLVTIATAAGGWTE